MVTVLVLDVWYLQRDIFGLAAAKEMVWFGTSFCTVSIYCIYTTKDAQDTLYHLTYKHFKGKMHLNKHKDPHIYPLRFAKRDTQRNKQATKTNNIRQKEKSLKSSNQKRSLNQEEIQTNTGTNQSKKQTKATKN